MLYQIIPQQVTKLISPIFVDSLISNDDDDADCCVVQMYIDISRDAIMFNVSSISVKINLRLLSDKRRLIIEGMREA